jgi:hypothetical protein
MVEKKYQISVKKNIIILLIAWGGIFIILILFRFLSTNPFLALMESWIAISSRGIYGKTDTIEQLRDNPSYTYELLWDIHYRHARIEKAIESYRKSIEIKSNGIVELKLALLTNETSREKKTENSSTWAANNLIDASLSRIEKDTGNRSKYFGKSEEYRNNYQVFETREQEVIDW